MMKNSTTDDQKTGKICPVSRWRMRAQRDNAKIAPIATKTDRNTIPAPSLSSGFGTYMPRLLIKAVSRIEMDCFGFGRIWMITP